MSNDDEEKELFGCDSDDNDHDDAESLLGGLADARKNALKRREKVIAENQMKKKDLNFDRFSGLQLSSRVLDRAVLESSMQGRELWRIGQLSSEILGRYASNKVRNWVTMGVLLKKQKVLSETGSKSFSIWTLGDLTLPKETRMDVFLYDSANRKRSDVALGTLLVLFEPRVAAKGNKGFIMNISHEEQVVVVGTARDFGQCCASIGSEAQQCFEPINKKDSRFCQKHQTEALTSICSNRMLLQSSGGATLATQRETIAKALLSVRNLSNPGPAIALTKGGSKSITSCATVLKEKMRKSREAKKALERSERSTGIVQKDGSVVMMEKTPSKKKSFKSVTDKNKAIDSIPVGAHAKRIAKIVSDNAKRGKSVLAKRGLSSCVASIRGSQVNDFALKEGNLDLLSNGMKQTGTKPSLQNILDSRDPQRGKARKDRLLASSMNSQLAKEVAFGSSGTSVNMDVLMQRKESMERQDARDRIKLMKKLHEKQLKKKEKEMKRSEVAKALKRKSVFLVPGPSLQGVKRLKVGASTPKTGRLVSKTSSLTCEAAEKILGTKSLVPEAAKLTRDEEFRGSLQRLSEAEKLAEQREKVTELEVNALFCGECETIFEKTPKKCALEAHEFTKIKVKKRFFKCKGCQNEKKFTLNKKKCVATCTICSGISWVPCSAYSDRRMSGMEKLPFSNF